MQSSTETGAVVNEAGQSAPRRLCLWNRRLHYYVGLYLLLFVWLFSLTGLLLNHPQWKFAEFWENRKQTSMDRSIRMPTAQGDVALAGDLMTQLGLHGELEWTRSRNDPNRFEFRVSRPGNIFEIKTDFAAGKATVQRIELNSWGVLRILHTFTGARIDDSRNTRDWWLTTVWAVSMDAVAVGLILMVVTSFAVWWERKPKRVSGAVFLLAGILVCGLFCFGLRWIF